MIYIGIDPGLSGGIAIISGARNVVETFLMPKTESDVLELLEQAWPLDDRRAALEHVWSIPGQGGAFKFGRNVGHLEMALTAARIPYDQVLPRRWQKAMGVAYPKGATDTEKKNITKRRAQQLFPRVTVTHAIADALLIAEFCRRESRNGSPHQVTRGVRNGKTKGRSAQQTREARGSDEAREGREQGHTKGARAEEVEVSRSASRSQGPRGGADVPGAGRAERSRALEARRRRRRRTTRSIGQ